jgi:hypothetical protein
MGNNFWEDAQEAFQKVGWDKEKIAEAIAGLRRDWKGTRIHITAYDSQAQRVAMLRDEYEKIMNKLCMDEGISRDELEKMLRGRIPKKKPQN